MVTARFARFQPPASSFSHRLPMAALTCAAALLLGVALAWAQSFGPTDTNAARTGPPENSGNATSPRADRRIREGTEIVDRLGSFGMTGDRVTFSTADGKGRFVVLENLGLERVVRAIADNPGRLQWAVTGTITEYRGANFLLIRHTVLRNRRPSSQENSWVRQGVGP